MKYLEIDNQYRVIVTPIQEKKEEYKPHKWESLRGAMMICFGCIIAAAKIVGNSVTTYMFICEWCGENGRMILICTTLMSAILTVYLIHRSRMKYQRECDVAHRENVILIASSMGLDTSQRQEETMYKPTRSMLRN